MSRRKGWRGPEYDGDFPSLGWQLLDLYEEFLRVPSGPMLGEPLRLTDDQATFTIRFYAIDPDTGRFIYRRGARRRAKGTGKSPHLAAFAIGELIGETVFDGWDADGNPVGRPREAAWVQIAACSEDQTDNTYLALRQMVADSPAVDAFGLDVGKTRVELIGRFGRIEPVTAAAGSREGQPITAAVLDETHLWTPGSGGTRLAATIRRNLAKMNGRSLDSTNAYVRGHKSVAEATDKAFERGEAGLLYDCVEGPAVKDWSNDKEALAALAIPYVGAPWVDLHRVLAECRDPETTPNDRDRFFLNRPVDDDDTESWLADVPGAWPACYAPDIDLPDTGCVIAVDASIKYDTTAVGVYGHNGGRIVSRVRVFEPRPGGGIDLAAVMAHIRAEAALRRPKSIAYDPAYFSLQAQELNDEGLPMEEFPQSHERMAPACGHLRAVIVDGRFAHDGNVRHTAHVLAAVKRETDRGFRFSKGHSKRPIDAVIVDAIGVWLLEQTAPKMEPLAAWA